MLVTEPVREAAEDRFDWSAAGEKKLKGLQKPLKTFRPRPRGAKQELTGTRSSRSSRSMKCSEAVAR